MNLATEVVEYSVVMERNIPARIIFLLCVYLSMGLLSTWYATARGYRVLPGLILSCLITPVLASILFKVRPKN